MKMIQKILNVEETNYISSFNEKKLKEKIQAIFKKKNIGIIGEITSKNEFMAYDKTVVIGSSVLNARTKAAYLKGEITSDENNNTFIKIKANPNIILPLFGLTSFIFGLLLTLIVLANIVQSHYLLMFGFLFLALGLIYYPLSILFKNRIRNKFVKNLELKKLNFSH